MEKAIQSQLEQAIRNQEEQVGLRDKEITRLRAQNAELTKELEKVREVLHEQTTYLEAMLNVYAELHANYDLGDCAATIAARAAIAKAKGDQS